MFRQVERSDKDILCTMMDEFYHSPAVCHPVPPAYFERTFDQLIQNGPYAEAYMFMHNKEASGYALLAKTWSNEAGGLVIWLEEIYIRPEFRGAGLGSAFLVFLEEKYKHIVARFRLEVEPDNEAAIRLYNRLQYQKLPYQQMIRPISEQDSLDGFAEE